MVDDSVSLQQAADMAEENLPKEQDFSSKDSETLTLPSNVATINFNAQHSTTESSCNNNSSSNAATSSLTCESDRTKSLEFAAELTERGSASVREQDFSEATDYFSRALEIRVAHYGELSPECIHTYYKYGRALLYKAQEEADPIAVMPKIDGESLQHPEQNGCSKIGPNDESITTSVSSNVNHDANLNNLDGTSEDVLSENDEEEEDDGKATDEEELDGADEDESDLDLAWKMLDVARAIAERDPVDTMDKVDILSALAEVALEREDIESSLSDYQKALSILARLVESDNRYIAELNFRICLCLEMGSKAEEAIPYCEKAISICKSRMQRLSDELKGSDAMTETPSVSDVKAEIETLDGLSSELEKKLEDLQQVVSNPISVLSEILGMVSAKAKSMEKLAIANGVMNSSQMAVANSGGFDSPTVSTAHTDGVTHLGVVGRGVKRVLTNSGDTETSASKKPAVENPGN